MAVAARVRARDFFEPDMWARLSARSVWMGPAMVAHCWIVIGLAMAAGMAWPWAFPICVMVIGTRQLGLAILMHDAAHGALHPNQKINDFLGEYLCTPGLKRYRAYHLQHHKFAQQAEDPDLVLSAPFPITRSSLGRKIIRDLTGQTFYKQRFGAMVARMSNRPAGAPIGPVLTAELWRMRRFLISNLLGLLIFAAFDLAWVYVLFWIVPMATWLPLVTRLRNIAEHALIAKDEPDPLKHARTTRANWLERALIAPYWVNYHGEHHLFMYVPCWQLPRLSAALKQLGVTAKMETAPSYFSVLMAASQR
jgi:fatty acid desaturase